MRNLLRNPLPWMVLAECAVVLALVIVAWHLVAYAPAPAVRSAPVTSAPAAAESTAPSNADLIGQSKTRPRALLPGLNVDANFWRLRLAELNGGEKAFEVLEWRLVHSATEAAHRYLESVVLPSIARAEGRRG